jgi:hypothetical protein
MQRFTGANDHTDVSGVRVTVFDGESSDSTTTATIMMPNNITGAKADESTTNTIIYLPPVSLLPVK